jgi:hypothetical protein
MVYDILLEEEFSKSNAGLMCSIYQGKAFNMDLFVCHGANIRFI